MLTKKVAVIGLDGVSWTILHNLLSNNAMPYLDSIVENSAKGVLKSTIPPTTPPAWTSIATGVNPGKHGIYDFVKLVGGYETKIITSLDVRYPRIHEMIALAGLKTISINIPFTFPILKIKNSIVVSDWIGSKICFFPRKIESCMKNYKPYSLSVPSLDKLYKETKDRVEAVNTLINKVEWNLFFVIFMEPDHVMHKYGLPTAKNEMEEQYYKIFTEIDKTIERASKIADLLIIISDHGFSEYRYRININSYLAKLGFTVGTYETSIKGIVDLKNEKRAVEIKVPSILYKLKSFGLVKNFAKRVYKLLTGKNMTAKWPRPNPRKSKAFLPTTESCGIYVKDKSLIDTVLLELKKLKGIKHVWKREDIYHGPYVNLAPHIIFQPNFDNGFTVGSTLITPLIFSKRRFYWHHPDGIVIVSGDDVIPGWWKREVETFDIPPTILQYMSLPLPVDTDGNPLQNINYPQKQTKHYDYLKHWQLIKQIQLKKIKLAI